MAEHYRAIYNLGIQKHQVKLPKHCCRKKSGVVQNLPVSCSATACSPVPLPIPARAKVMPEQLIGGLDTVEVMVSDLLSTGVCESPDVLSEGRLPWDGLECQYGSHHQASPGECKAGNVQDAVNRPPSVLVAPAKCLTLSQRLSDIHRCQPCMSPKEFSGCGVFCE